MATFVTFGSFDKVDTNDKVFASAWSDNTNDLTTNHFSSSAQYITTSPTSSGQYFMEIYSTNPDTNPTTAEVQYSIAYGNRLGSGSLNLTNSEGALGFSATKAIYNQYRNLVFGGDETQNFSFDGHVPNDIYVINVNRARYKNAIRLGNLDFKLNDREFTDDSLTTSGSANAIRAGVGREFNIVSGSNGVRLGSSNTFVTDSGSYGYVYPDAGLIILNADALDATVADGGIALGTDITPNNSSRNPQKLQEAFKAGGKFVLDSQETVSSKFYFVRARNDQFNYSTNDSFTLSDGTLRHDSMIENPRVYITTIGLYNNNQDLLAVAKLSQPLPKDFTKEALIKVKLDY